jgi:phosphoribosylglycinamide formyltransferase 1
VDARIAVLVSGAGTNLQALLDDPMAGPAIVLVVSDRPGVFALERASRAGLKALVLQPGDFESREAHDVALVQALKQEAIDVVVLAGYMRILSREFVDAFENRVLNIHPSLLPAFPGAHAVRDAIDWGVKVTGVTVHLVDSDVDHGPIVSQEPVLVLPGDDETSLHRRIQEVEHRIYRQAAALLGEGRLKVEGRRVHVLEPDEVQ